MPVLGDGRCFYRCLASFLFKELLEADRLECGLPGLVVHPTPGYEDVEASKADDLRKVVVDVMKKEEQLLSRLSVNLPFILDNTLSTKFTSVQERIASMMRVGSFAGNLELLAAGFALRTQIHVYHENASKSIYELIAKLPTYHFAGQTPVRLINKEDKKGQSGHFDLLIVNNKSNTHFQQFSVSTTVYDVINGIRSSISEYDQQLQFEELFSQYESQSEGMRT